MEAVREFYNRTPFPDYDLKRYNTVGDILITDYIMPKLIDRSIPEEATVIDVGCGTGQLIAYLSLRRKFVMGVDFSGNSLRKAQALKERLDLKTLHLKKIDIMHENEIKDIGEKFDYVLCLGVLHHTENPYQAFKNILPLMKENGYIAIGLYNKFGRVPLKARKLLIKTIFRNNQKVKDYFINLQIGSIEDRERAKGWWNDQYLHPHETTHTVGEILRWFKENNISFYKSIPALDFFNEGNLETVSLFNREKYPGFAKRLLKQLAWVYTTHRDGGFWIMMGRKK